MNFGGGLGRVGGFFLLFIRKKKKKKNKKRIEKRLQLSPSLPQRIISVKSYAIKKHNAMYFHFLVSISHFDRKFCIAHTILVTFVSPVTI